ncbi:hypothetical protein JOF53_002720 [Crossiella equi]|uniref:C-type lectin domain-containing protein n=1 Tax=Crossiella equi TaxID=130796 RepID=A0ABS5AB91_9PSEU|nr:hypothetical protein [Crossiella equi]MBP2473848.1 hypothetical protein [Crossiella equi]
MLEVELDIFSGMPNPTWHLSEADERELVARVTSAPEQLSPVATEDEQFSLGYRGLVVRMIKSTEGAWQNTRLANGASLPLNFRVGSRPAAEPIADWLLGTSASVRDSGVDEELTELAAQGVSLLRTAAQSASPAGALPESTDGEHPDTANERGDLGVLGSTWWACGSNLFSANAQYFNDPAHIGINNCYCFASNHLADVRYALPGRRGGRPATSITCGGVTDGLRADGWSDSCQQNTLTIAMVIWPGRDYHFYRLVTGGPNWWWGHKPGATPAKYTDDCGHAIYQENGRGYAPNNICRGPYTDFCGYFYQNNNTAYVA